MRKLVNGYKKFLVPEITITVLGKELTLTDVEGEYRCLVDYDSGDYYCPPNVEIKYDSVEFSDFAIYDGDTEIEVFETQVTMQIFYEILEREFMAIDYAENKLCHFDIY